MTSEMSRAASDVEALRQTVEVIERWKDESERERRQAPEAVAAMRDAGLLRLWVPREYGGEEAGLPAFMEVVEQISNADAAAGWTFANLAAGAALPAFLPPEGASEIYASGPDVAIPASVAPAGRAVRQPEGYRLSGLWPLSSGCDDGDWLAAAGVVFDGEAPAMTAPGVPELVAIFLPREDYKVLDTWHSHGLRGTGSAHVQVEDVFIPRHRVFSVIQAAPQVSGRLYRAGIMGLFSMALVPVLLGTARAAIDAFVALAKEKTPTLSQTGLAARPTIHAGVARAEALLGSARAYLFETAREMEQSVENDARLPDHVEAKRRLACVTAGEASARVVEKMFALSGSTPVYTGQRLERLQRDVHTARQHMAMSPVLWEKTEQYFFGQGLGLP